MISTLCIFEDNQHHTLLPISYARASYDIRLGFDTLYEKIATAFPKAKQYACCRKEIEPFVKKAHPKVSVNKVNKGTPCLFVNGRVLMTHAVITAIEEADLSQNALFTHKNQVVAVYARGESLQFMDMMLKAPLVSTDSITHFRNCSVCKELTDVQFVSYPGDLIRLNNSVIELDFKRYNQPGIIKGKVNPFTAVYNEHDAFIDSECQIEDFVVLDASNGPIYISKGVHIKAHTRIEGPLYIGEGCHILGGSIKSSSIGPYCKISGEISHSIIQGYSNKAHAGFVGHSFLGEWVNLGAGTTTSNLKVNYKPININSREEGQFLGSIISDHVKTGIGTLLNTGVHVGFGSTLLEIGIHKAMIEPFSWGAADAYELTRVEAFLKTAAAMMNRRNMPLTEQVKQCIHERYELEKYKQTHKAKA